jgi:hypothetical protein
MNPHNWGVNLPVADLFQITYPIMMGKNHQMGEIEWRKDCLLGEMKPNL